MKKYIFALTAALCLLGCEDTNENLVQDRGGAVVPIMSDPSPAYFSDDIESSYIQFDLSLATGETIDKAEIEVESGGKSAIVKAVSIPATGVTVTAREVLTALNISESDYNLGDVFNLYILTTKNGKTTRSIASVGIPVVCYFEPSMLVGNFDFVSYSWDEEGSVTIEADPDDPYKVFIHGLAEAQGLDGNGNGIELTMNPNNFSISGVKSVIADSGWGGYTNIAFQATTGTYSACDEVYTISFAISCDQGGFGTYVFYFTRK